ncbi:MAG: sulfite exporter TauE/SafE family protein [Lachnospiraceae bacterium]
MFTIIISILAGLGAGLGTGLAGMSAASVVSPMLITFVGINAYEAIGIALFSDVLASAVSAYTYSKNKNIDIKNGLTMMTSVLVFTMIGSYLSSLVDVNIMGGLSVFSTLFMGLKFLIMPVKTTKSEMQALSAKKRFIQSIMGGIVIGLICGFVGAGGGIMMLMILTIVLGYELKTAIGTSVFIMSFTAFTGAVSHFYIGGFPDMTCLIVCSISTLVFAQLAATFANKISSKLLNLSMGIILTILGMILVIFNYLL